MFSALFTCGILLDGRAKAVVGQHHRVDWTGPSVGDAVKMTQDRDVWRTFVFGLNGP